MELPMKIGQFTAGPTRDRLAKITARQQRSDDAEAVRTFCHSDAWIKCTPHGDAQAPVWRSGGDAGAEAKRTLRVPIQGQ
jgi:hypothetical protein